MPFINGMSYITKKLLTVRQQPIMTGVIGVDMPSNWTALHWGLSHSNSTAIIARAKTKVSGFMEVILSERRYYGGFFALFLGILLLQISMGYILFGRIIFAKLFFSSNSCNGCGICVKNCPAQAIKMFGEKPYWTYRCESCMRCMNFCPNRSVEASHSLAVILYYITAIPVWQYVLNRVTDSIPGMAKFNNDVTTFVLQYIYFLISIFLTYLVFSILNRVPIISRIFALTTLTHYYRRYHEPDTKLVDISPKSR